MTALLATYHEIYKVQRDYCVICMRSSEERRMGDMKILEKFIKSINLPCCYRSKNQKICYICERRAAAAYEFRLSVNLSGAVHGLYRSMDRSTRAYDDIQKQLRGFKQQSDVTRHSMDWAESLRSVRARSMLLRTETLTVNSLEMPGENVLSGGHSRENDPDSCGDMYLVPDEYPARSASPALPPTTPAPPASPALPPTTPANPAPPAPPAAPEGEGDPRNDEFEEPEIFMESVVLDEGEVDPILIKHEDPTFGELTVEEELLGQTPQRDGATPMNKSNGNAPCLVPVETLIDSTNTANLALLPDGLMQRNPVEPTTFILHPILCENGVFSVPSLAAQVVGGKLMRRTGENSNIIIETPKLALQDGQDFNVFTDPGQVTTLLNNITDGNMDMQHVTVGSENIAQSTVESNLMQSLRQVNVLHDAMQSKKAMGGNRGSAVVTNNNRQSKGPIKIAMKGDTVRRSSSVLSTESHNIASDIRDLFVRADENATESIIIFDDSEDVEMFDERTRRMKETECRERVRDRRGSETKSKRSKREGGDAAKKQRETDWEDKIPTEVIATMDSVDPNAAAVLSSPTISIIHSVREDVRSSTEHAHHKQVKSAHVTRSIRSLVESVQCAKQSAIVDNSGQKPNPRSRATVGQRGGKAGVRVSDIIDLC